MRRLLDALYDGAAWAGALFMVGTLLSVLAGVLDRQFAWSLRGTDMYAGYCMAASGFLALAHTLKKGEHIRVTLILNALKGSARRAIELWALAAATALSMLFAWYSVKLSINSWQFHDVSTGNDATPLWIPQLSMGVGAVILMIAFIDELVLEISGRRLQGDSDEALHYE
ncbi:TRAP transporter small permease subunit [Polaromonas sp.]|uniref:TRAP transporter small permease n=1 Tax=Polaromonas sp. TaxID=1869339 RepID=UPI00286CE10B|nr:TRAP transporter small permease subunit [Polaromonas sp.]